MVLGVLKKGDEVLNVTAEFIAVKRRRGDVDVIPFMRDGGGWRVDLENIVNIGYGDNTVTYENEDGIEITDF